MTNGCCIRKEQDDDMVVHYWYSHSVTIRINMQAIFDLVSSSPIHDSAHAQGCESYKLKLSFSRMRLLLIMVHVQGQGALTRLLC